MSNIIRMKTKNSLGIDKLEFLDHNGNNINEAESKRLHELIYKCVAERDDEFDFFTLIHINYDSIETLKEKTNNKPYVRVAEVSNAVEMQVIVDVVKTRDFFCIVEGRPDASIQELQLDKYFTQFYCVGMRVNKELEKPFRLNIFYKPI